tara:strand:- start:242 stop:583 length:342 start_codon:yes stop_codon:yes gene_type:complete
MFLNLDTGLTRDKYFDMQEQLGREPLEDEIPPDWADFPTIVQNALNSFNQLGDRVYPEIGYVGKDYTNLKYFIEIYGITDIEFYLEIISWLDSRAIKKSSEQLKKDYAKLKRK